MKKSVSTHDKVLDKTCSDHAVIRVDSGLHVFIVNLIWASPDLLNGWIELMNNYWYVCSGGKMRGVKRTISNEDDIAVLIPQHVHEGETIHPRGRATALYRTVPLSVKS